MRDVRARILAVGLIQLAAVVFYFVSALLMVFFFDYSDLFLDPLDLPVNLLTLWLIAKGVSTGLVFVWVLYDADVVLCLWYFGCLGCCVGYVKRYIKDKRVQIGGFPLAYAYFKTRFQILLCLKGMDFVCGLYGWVLLGRVYGSKWFNIEAKLKAFFSLLSIALVVTDVHLPMLLVSALA
jgi:hypothetical protein